ncbi:hypothetical protein EDD90_4098 [Streptomyces sp. Ag109_O5-1]|uniref:hypothetical protein n=1 Tax=Streptomyces sp. Ag109_O5-1 TaxID=1938851 RepID=UPI000F511983|nr:hypothetical protein [Streptomyces sp. Ag109_O5-1]RPE41024.1 hypothetical protein EDD90_4098 [Streptomyces sp. Ag109_O5-1]
MSWDLSKSPSKSESAMVAVRRVLKARRTGNPPAPRDGMAFVALKPAAGKRGRDDDASGRGKKARDEEPEPVNRESLRAWAQGSLQVSWNWNTGVLTQSGRPRQQFSSGEGTHTVAWTSVDRAVQANLSGSKDVSEALVRLEEMAGHLAKSPLAGIAPPIDQQLRKKQGTDYTVSGVAVDNLEDSLASAKDKKDEQSLNEAIKDFLVLRNTLPFASIQGPAPGAAEGTYAQRLTEREALLQSRLQSGRVARALPKRTQAEIKFATWRLVDTAALLGELTDSDVTYGSDVATTTFSAVVATLLDEISRWAPLSLQAANLLVPGAGATKNAEAVVASLESYLGEELSQATAEDKRAAAQWQRETGGTGQAASRPRETAKAWQARADWLGRHNKALEKQIRTHLEWVGVYGFAPTHVVRGKEPLTVTADFSGGTLRVAISGRPQSPYSGSQGSHITAWEVERLATENRLQDKTPEDVAEELQAMYDECRSTPSAKLVKRLPEDERASTATLMKDALEALGEAIEDLPAADDLAPVVVKAVQAYQDYRNALPFATTFAGSRSGHGEGTYLKNAGKMSRNDLSKALFDNESLEDEIDYLGLLKYREAIFKARRLEHRTQFNLAFPE